MKIKLKVQKREFYAIIGVLLLLTSFVAINAFGTSSPSTFGHSSSEIQNGTLQGDFIFADGITFQNNLTLGGIKRNSWPSFNVSGGQVCHWEESWLTYPNGGSVSEKKSCDVGQCMFKLDNTACNPSSASCNNLIGFVACGDTSNGNDEWLYCCS